MANEKLALAEEEAKKIATTMTKKYEAYLKDRQFYVETNHQDNIVGVKVLLRNTNESFYYPVEGRVDLVGEELANKREAALFLIDFIDLYFTDYFDEDEALYLPIDWSGFEYDAVNFQLRGQILNLHVERMADALLAADKNQSAPH